MTTFKVHDLVWAYVRGFCHWPGVIEEVLPNGKYRIHFFGDYSRADVTRMKIVNFFEGFNKFSSNFGNLKLQKAVQEASFFLYDGGSKEVCYVCNVIGLRSEFRANTNKKDE